MIRLFVALEIPAVIRARLTLLQTGLPAARWTPPEYFHLTLRFIGEVDEGRARDIDDVLSSIEADAFELALSAIGLYGGREPHTLWVGVRPCPGLEILHNRIENSLQRFGLPAERRKFSPHVTLARLKDCPEAKLAQYVAANNLFDSGPFPVSRFCLYSSVLSHGGSHYEIERTYPLVGD
jgi:2'-5' RNA ligase